MEHKPLKENSNSPIELIKEMVSTIQYGTISVIVQDGKIVQIDKLEKYRIKN